MANYLDFDYSSCLDEHDNKISQWGQPNPCVPYPSTVNPYNITKLTDFKMSMLQEIITNDYFGINLAMCYYASHLLPESFVAIDSVIDNPSMLDLAVLTLHDFTTKALPATINGSSPRAVSDWWWDNVANDRIGTATFLNATKYQCTGAICHSLSGIGDPDITGIGMLISTAMLIVLAVLFAFPALFSWTPLGSHRQGVSSLSKRWVLRDSLVASLDDLFSAVILFTVSVLISTIIYRLWNETYYDIFMAEVLSLISSTAMVMIGASYWNHFRVRPTNLIGFVANSLLTIILFGIEFWFQHSDEEPEGLPLEHQCLRGILGGTNLNNLGNKKTRFPACFTLWALSLLCSMLHIIWAHRGRPSKSGTRGFLANGCFLVMGWIPIIFGTATIIWLCVIFYSSWRDMRNAFGKSFVDTSRDWSFGQFLALVTWIPSILQFAHLMFCEFRDSLFMRQCADFVYLLAGISKGLTAKLPKPLIALFPSEDEKGVEKQSSTAGDA